jgi:hypothetical protein
VAFSTRPVAALALGAVLITGLAACSVPRSSEVLPDGVELELVDFTTTFVRPGPDGSTALVAPLVNGNRSDHVEVIEVDGVKIGESLASYEIPGGGEFFTNSGDLTKDYVAVAAYDSVRAARIVVWRRDGTVVGDFPIDIGDDDLANLPVTAVVSDDAHIVVGRNIVGELAAWDLETGEQLFRKLWGPGHGPYLIGSDRAVFTYSSSVDESWNAEIIDIRDGSTVWSAPLDDSFTALAASAASGRFATVTSSGVQFWDRDGNQSGDEIEVRAGDYTAAFASDGELLTLGTLGGDFVNVRAGAAEPVSEGSFDSEYDSIGLMWVGGTLIVSAGLDQGQYWSSEGLFLWRAEG